MTSWLALIALAVFVTALPLNVAAQGDTNLEYVTSGLLALASWASFVIAVWQRNWIGAGTAGFSAVVWTLYWWRKRKNRRRKRVLGMLGEKSRALIGRMVRNMRPVPQGAGA